MNLPDKTEAEILLERLEPGRVEREVAAVNDARDRRLCEAWIAIAAGRGSREDGRLVVNDLARFTGFYDVHGEAVASDVMRFREGMRAVFFHVRQCLRQPADADQSAT